MAPYSPTDSILWAISSQTPWFSHILRSFAIISGHSRSGLPLFRPASVSPYCGVGKRQWNLMRTEIVTDVPAYSDTGYSDTLLIVTLWAGPKSINTVRNPPLTVIPLLE